MPELLMPRIARGDPSAMRECFDRFGGLVWSLAVRLLTNRADAEDAVQEAFIDVWKSAERYRPDLGSEVAFVTMVVRRRLIDRKRRIDRNPSPTPLSDEVPEAVDTMVDSVAVSEEAEKAREVLAGLDPEQRRVIELVVCCGLSHQQVAEKTSLPLGTVKTYVRRGLMRVRERMRSPGQPEGSD